MCSVPLSVLLLLLWGRVSVAGPQCERSSAVKVSVSSWRNQTGHRLLSAEMRAEDSLEDTVCLSVEQWTERCGAADTVTLSLTTSRAKSTSAAITTGVLTTPVTTTSVLPTVTVRPTPRPDYHHLPGHGYYKQHGGGMPWEEGRRICESEGAHLAVLETREEFDAVFDFSGCCPWIGVYRLDASSQWMTVLGKPLNTSGFTGWLPGYPRVSGDCVPLDLSSVRGFSNMLCSSSLPVICEQDV